MRWLLILVLINGLAPGIAEAVEAAVHYVGTSHLAHSPGEKDLGDQGSEHSCGVVFHHCACCSAMMMTEHAEESVLFAPTSEAAPSMLDHVTNRSLEPPFRPPIR